MTNSFSSLKNEEPEETTKNPQRKLDKMKRKYAVKPTPELKKKIEEMDSRLNPKKDHSNNNSKKKNVDIDLETEYKKNKEYWEEYWEKESERKEQEEAEKERLKEVKQRLKEERKRMRKEREEMEDEYEYVNSSFTVDKETKDSLPEDIKEFLNYSPDTKMFRKLCLKYHPDKGGDEELFKIINNHNEQSK
jgi:hypothetical protein